MRSFHTLLIVLASLSVSLRATEIDSFTDRDPLLKDSSRAVSRIINRYFEEAISAANSAGSCDQSVLDSALNTNFRGFLWSPIEKAIDSDSSIDKRHSLVRDSIYQDFNAIESPTFVIAEIAAVIRLGKHYVGVDKLAHFLQLGYDMYKRHYLRGKKLKDVIAWSSWTEQTYYGLLTTGVYSYGDLAANYDGLLFWEQITNTRLAPGVEPYFACHNNVWWLNKSFDISEYVTAAWDEGINCNRYRTSAMEKKVLARVAVLESKTGRSLQCPIKPELCSEMIAHYGEVAPHIITPLCF
jgi:hypothetical protein